jgi:hypothetical protein
MCAMKILAAALTILGLALFAAEPVSAQSGLSKGGYGGRYQYGSQGAWTGGARQATAKKKKKKNYTFSACTESSWPRWSRPSRCYGQRCSAEARLPGQGRQ